MNMSFVFFGDKHAFEDFFNELPESIWFTKLFKKQLLDENI